MDFNFDSQVIQYKYNKKKIFQFFYIGMLHQRYKNVGNKKFRYVFEAYIEKIHINIKFPCKLSLCWYFGQGEVKTTNSKQLINNVARIDQKLSFKASVTFDEEKQKYLEHRTSLQVSLITDNSTNIAGFVYIDIGNLIQSRQKRQVFDIERCPDKSANIYMKISFRYLSEKLNQRTQQKPQRQNHYLAYLRQSPRLDTQQNFQHMPQFRRSTTPKSEYITKTEYGNILKNTKIDASRQYKNKTNNVTQQYSNKNRQLVEKQLTILKQRVSEFENKYKNERIQKQKISQILKNKQESTFTLKTEVKRKEIQLEDMFRSLEQYKSEYQRLKRNEQMHKRDSEKYQNQLQKNERMNSEKIMKLQSQLSIIEKKYQKLSIQYEKNKKQKENLSTLIKQKNEVDMREKDNLKQIIKNNKKQREDIQKNYRIEKETLEKNIRQLNKTIKQSAEHYHDLKDKFTIIQKKYLKAEETKNEEFERFTAKINQLQKFKDNILGELQSYKLQLQKKELELQENKKNYERAHNQQKMNNTKIKKNLTDIQVQKERLHKEIEIYKQSAKSLQEQFKKLEKELIITKTQNETFNQQNQNLNLQIKTLNSKIKINQEDYQREKNQMQLVSAQTIQDLENRLKELKKTEQIKNLNLSKLLTKKQKQLEDTLNRQSKLNQNLENQKQQLKKLQIILREKIETTKKMQQQFKQEIQQLNKKCQQVRQDYTKQNETLSKNLQNCEQKLQQANENLEKSFLREKIYKQQIQHLQSINNQLNNQLLLTQYRIQEYQIKAEKDIKIIQEYETEIKVKDVKEATIYKNLAQLKQKIIDIQAEKSKKQVLLKERQKNILALSKQYMQEIDDKKKQITKKQLQLKTITEEFRENSRKDKNKLNQKSFELEKISNQLISMTNLCQKYQSSIQQYQNEIRILKQNEMILIEEKQKLIQIKQESQTMNRQSQSQRIQYEETIQLKSKQFKIKTQQLNDLDSKLKQLNKLYTKNNIIIEEIQQIIVRLFPLFNSKEQNNRSRQVSTKIILNEYEKLLEIRKSLLIIQGKKKKEIEINNQKQKERIKQNDNSQNSIQTLETELNRYKNELNKFKKENEQILYENCSIKIQNQQLGFKIEDLQCEIQSLTNNISNQEIKIKNQNVEFQNSKVETKRTVQKYESLLDQIRNSLTQKAEKQRKQLNEINKKLELKIQQLQQANFNYELENQKIGQLMKRQEQNKKIIARVYELQKQNIQISQNYSEKYQKLNSQYQKLKWSHNNLEDLFKNNTNKYQKNLTTLQHELEKIQSKLKETTSLLHQKENVILKLQQNVSKSQNELSFIKSTFKEEKQKLSINQTKLKAQLIRVKGELTNIKRQLEEEKEKTEKTEEIKLIKNNLEQELRNKQIAYSQLQIKSQKDAQDLYKLRQQYEQSKWQFQQKLDFKQNQIMSIQEQLYSLNSKDNVRVLKQQQYAQKSRQLQHERKLLYKQLNEYKNKNIEYQQRLRSLSIQKQDLSNSRKTKNQRLTKENQMRYQEIVKILEKEITELKSQNSVLRSRCSYSNLTKN